MEGMIKFQIGKAGITDGTVQSLRNALKTHKIIRVSVLKGAAPDKAKVASMAQELRTLFKDTIGIRVVGFTIIVRRLKSFNSLS